MTLDDGMENAREYGDAGKVPARSHQASSPALSHRPVALADLLDRLLAGGVVISGDIRLAIADVDLVTISLQALISSVETAFPGPRSD
jgi:hypothetical protein